MHDFTLGRYSTPDSAHKAGVPVEEWAVNHVPWIIGIDMPRKLRSPTKALSYEVYATQFSVAPSSAGWMLACSTTRRLPGDWLVRPVTHWPGTRAEARDSWYAAGDGVAPPKNTNRRPDWVFYRALWVTYEKLTRELATEYARRVQRDRSLNTGPRDSVIPTLQEAFTICVIRTGYVICCCGLRKRLRDLPSWHVFDETLPNRSTNRRE